MAVMLRRLLNIASIICLGLCVALMGMWVRSFITEDVVSAGTPRFSRCMQLVSSKGRAKIQFYKASPRTAYREWLSMSLTGRPADNGPYDGPAIPAIRELFSFTNSQGTFALVAPYWLFVLLSGFLAMLFQLRWPPRFTLRTLFIATTFIAVVLGMIAWLDRLWIGK
jgi:hypothetical protein